MNPIKLLRKLGKVLRGGAAQRDIFLGVFLGFAVGMIPGVNLTLIVCIALLLFVNTNGAAAAPALVLGKVLCLVLAPVTFEIGYFLIHTLGLSGLVRVAGNTPVLALLDLQVYCLIGALPIIIILGGAMAWLMARAMIGVRKAIIAGTARSDRMTKLAGNKAVRLVLRVVFGKKKGALADSIEKKSPLFRKGRLIVAAVLVGALVALPIVFLDSALASVLETGIAAANGAEVNIGSASLSLFGGRLELKGLQVTDPDRPTHNRVQADRIVVDVSIRDLLARRLVMERVECEAMRMDTERQSPGEVYRKRDEAPRKDISELLDFAKLGGKATEYYTQIKKFDERLRKVTEYLKSDDPGEDISDKPDKAKLAEQARLKGYLRLSAADVLTRHPTWVLRIARVSKLSISPNFPTWCIEGRNLSSHPSLHPEPMELKAVPDEDALKAFLEGIMDLKVPKDLKDLKDLKGLKGLKDLKDKLPDPLKIFGR